ncbi:MAG: amidohydrolase [Bacteroidetes bacterium]|nr:amidohydrolase [Bacteroidota bacterium]
MNNLTITLIQPELAWEDKEKNLKKFEALLRPLKQLQDLVVLPEMFSTGFVVDSQSLAEAPDGPTVSWMAVQASRLDSVIVGSLVVKDQGKYVNRLIWMKPDGTFVHYDKRHLFRLGNEHLQFSPGSGKIVVELNGWKICPLVCYDLRFPVWSKNTYKDGSYEYDILLYVANWPGRRSYAFRQLLIARAIENQAYVVGVNRVGTDGKGINHLGESAVLDFKGKHIIELPPGVEDMETVALAYEDLRVFREGFTVGLDWDEFRIVD